MPKKQTRVFHYDGTQARRRKPSFEVRTALTDAEAMALLRGEGSEFALDCANEIDKMSRSFEHKANLVAWAFKLAERIANPPPTVSLSGAIRGMVRFRKPLKGMADGNPFKVSLCGANSRHAGSYSITDGGPFGSNQFYGYAKPDGTWTPTQATPEAIVAALTKE